MQGGFLWMKNSKDYSTTSKLKGAGFSGSLLQPGAPLDGQVQYGNRVLGHEAMIPQEGSVPSPRPISMTEPSVISTFAGSKVNPDFGSQNIVITGTISGSGSGLTNLPAGPLGTSIDSTDIVEGSLTDDDIAATAAISGRQINPGFGAQNIVKTGTIPGDDSGLTSLSAGALSND